MSAVLPVSVGLTKPTTVYVAPLIVMVEPTFKLFLLA